jgi:hypothetical protein
MNLSLPRHVTLSSGLLYQELTDGAVLLDLASEQYIGLDPVGARIWQLAAANGDVEHVIAQMLEEFDVDETTLRHDIALFIRKLCDEGVMQAESTEPSTASLAG